jgi:hypothetical protein
MIKNILCSLLLFVGIQSFAKNINFSSDKYSVIASAGKGFPSLLGYIAAKNANKEIEKIQYMNPTMLKLEYTRTKWGVAITYTFNNQEFNLLWSNTNPQLRSNLQLKTWDIGLRGNFYFINKTLNTKIGKHLIKDYFQWYAGGGIGYIETKQYTKFIGAGFNDPATVTKTYGSFPMSFEATIGTRYFVGKYFGIFLETGLGNSPIQLIDKGASDSYVQTGLSIKI